MDKQHTDKVKTYYDKMTRSYLQIYGEVIQAFRPSRTKNLLKYIAISSGLKKNMNILDAGCGVCGPAIYFAKNYKVNIDAITISPIQVEIAQQEINKNKLGKYINVIEGDYHKLNQYYTVPNKYDLIFFLESLGHSTQPETIINQAFNLLKKGGKIYIKDFYKKNSINLHTQQNIDQVIQSINKHYEYNTLELTNIINSLRSAGFEIDFIKKFDFKDDISIRFEFEQHHNIDIFGEIPEFYPAEWLEICCTKT